LVQVKLSEFILAAALRSAALCIRLRNLFSTGSGSAAIIFSK